MTKKTKSPNHIPSLKNWGGVRSIQSKLKRSNTLIHNREAVAYELLCMANTKITDVMSWDENNKVVIKASSKIPEHALRAIKNIKIRRDKDGNETGTVTYDSGKDDSAFGVAVDSEGNVIVTGYSTNENGNKDYYTIKYGAATTVTAPGGGGLSGIAIAGIGVGAFVAGGLISYLITRRR